VGDLISHACACGLTILRKSSAAGGREAHPIRAPWRNMQIELLCWCDAGV
jgi:hypothetical protein